MEQEKLIYEAPEVEVIEVEVEQGFQASGGTGNAPTYTPDSPY